MTLQDGLMQGIRSSACSFGPILATASLALLNRVVAAGSRLDITPRGLFRRIAGVAIIATSLALARS